MTPDQIKHMVDRFLSWRLPESFAPDGGVTLTERYSGATGTNLLDATQAEAMVRHMLEGIPKSPADDTGATEA